MTSPEKNGGPEKNAVNDNAGKAACPACKKPAATAYAPFCSKRCADVDLHRWLSGGYAIPAVDDDNADPSLEE